MQILTLNCGSSSLKYSLWDMPARSQICHGIVERIATEGSFVKHCNQRDQESVRHFECTDHTRALELVFDLIRESGNSGPDVLSKIGAVAHRVSHGGVEFDSAVLIDEMVIRKIEGYSSLAPLHNPPQLSGIRAGMKLLPGARQVVVFDTAFFTKMPPHVFTYAVPYEWYEKHHVRRYGFHGTSHAYVSGKAAALLGKKLSETNLVTLHIGSGVSVTAVKSGIAYDHSLGFSTVCGAVMGTRCGDIDPAIPLYMMKQLGLDPEQMEDILYRKSGLLGITGKYSDRRDIVRAMEVGDTRSALALEMECYRLRKFIGAYVAAMGGADAIVFTAGVGENSALHRAKICEGLEFMGVKLDAKKNEQAASLKRDVDISTPDAKIRVLVIPTNEELQFAEEVFNLLKTQV